MFDKYGSPKQTLPRVDSTSLFDCFAGKKKKEKTEKVINLVKCRHVCRAYKMHDALLTTKLSSTRGDKKKRQMSILCKRANATARHEIDSKLKTMSMRITENPAGRRGGGGGWGGLPDSIFSLKRAIYIRITLNYWRKYSQSLAHTVGNHFFSPSVTKQTPLDVLNKCGEFFRSFFGEQFNSSVCTFMEPSSLFTGYHLLFLLYQHFLFFSSNIFTLDTHLKTFILVGS